MVPRRSLVALLLLIVFLGGCAARQHAPSPADPLADEAIPDPLEPLNRAMFRFNDVLITDVFGPVRAVYVGVFPQDVRNGFGNFYRNLAAPVRVANALLQLKVEKAAAEVVRFLLNTTFGILGFFDVSRPFVWLNPSPEDFGQTLGHAGAGHGFYLVLPVLGPTSLRDGVGLVADALASPTFWWAPLTPHAWAIQTHNRANTLSQYFDEYQKTKADALDPYLSFKDIYTQHRDALVRE
jgi:phospholipid-binding lipoprotein MlaA